MATKSEVMKKARQGRGCLGKADDNEPVFILRAQDKFAPQVIEYWALLVRAALPMDDSRVTFASMDKVRDAEEDAALMRGWQAAHPERVKVPD